VKIVGRGNPTSRKIVDVTFIRSLLDLLGDRRITKDEFQEVAQKLYMSTYKRECRVYRCYYPSMVI